MQKIVAVIVKRRNGENVLNVPQYSGMPCLQGEALKDANQTKADGLEAGAGCLSQRMEVDGKWSLGWWDRGVENTHVHSKFHPDITKQNYRTAGE